jgi:peroxiredoxin
MGLRGRSDLAQRVLTTLLGIMSLTVIGLTVHNRYLDRSLAQVIIDKSSIYAPVQYGARLNADALRRALRQAGYDGALTSPRYVLFYFLRPSSFSNPKSIKYGEALLRRHQAAGLQVLGITDAEECGVRPRAQGEELSFPILCDKDGTIKLLFHMPVHDEYAYLISSDGQVMFSLPGAPPEDLMRQVVEKYVVGRIDYSRDHARRLYRVGETLPSINVVPVAGGKPFDFTARGNELVLISARCTSCQLHAFMDRYRALLASDRPRFLIFSQRFPQQTLLKDLTMAGIPVDNIYLAQEPLGDLENEYRTKTGDDESSVIVEVDAAGRIEAVNSFLVGE